MANPLKFSAAFDSSNVELAFVEETTWGNTNNTAPSATGQVIRLMGESLTETRNRTRPAEINASGQASASLTTQVQAGGGINIGISYGTYDELFKGLLNASGNGNWTTNTTYGITSGNIGAVDKTTGVTLDGGALAGLYPGFTTASSVLTAGFSVGDWIKVTGFTGTGYQGAGNNDAGRNNGFWRIVGIKADGLAIAVDGPGYDGIFTTVAAANRKIQTNGRIRNGNNVHSYTVEKKLATGKYLVYPGTYVSGGGISAALGGFVEGSLQLLSQGEKLGATTAGGAYAGTGANSIFTTRTPAPAGNIIDTMGGISFAALGYVSGGWKFESVLTSGSGLAAVLQQFSINVTKNNARQQFGIGDVNAKGIGKGTIQVDGAMQMYFADFTMYQQYKSESRVVASFKITDADLNTYIITLPAVVLMNPNLVAGGPDTDLVAEFQLEANPGFTLPVGAPAAAPVTETPYTIQIDRFKGDLA